MYAQIITSSLTVGLGGSAGLESPLLWLVPLWIKLCAALQTELQGQDPTYWLWCRCRNSRSIMLLLQVFYLLSILLVDVSIAAFTPIMIAAATGALVSEIVLDETVLLNFKQQQVFDYHKIPFISF
jgi:CIC family chloride channel protein